MQSPLLRPLKSGEKSQLWVFLLLLEAIFLMGIVLGWQNNLWQDLASPSNSLVLLIAAILSIGSSYAIWRLLPQTLPDKKKTSLIDLGENLRALKIYGDQTPLISEPGLMVQQIYVPEKRQFLCPAYCRVVLIHQSGDPIRVEWQDESESSRRRILLENEQIGRFDSPKSESLISLVNTGEDEAVLLVQFVSKS